MTKQAGINMSCEERRRARPGARPGHLLWSGVRMTALLKASVGVGIEERVEEREVASSHDLEEDCGERMEHSRLDDKEYGQRIGQTAWRP